MASHQVITPDTARDALNLDESVAQDIINREHLPEGEQIRAVIWPGHMPEDLAALDLAPEIDRVMAVSTGYNGIADYRSADVDQAKSSSHEIASKFYQEAEESVFDFEYGHAVREDFSHDGHQLSRDEKMERIRRLGRTSNLLLTSKGRAVYNLNQMDYPGVNERREGFTTRDYHRENATLFENVLEGDYFESVDHTNDISGGGYHEDTHFVIADEPVLSDEECTEIINHHLEP